MAQGSFSQQIQSKQEGQRTTRSQRKLQEQERKRYNYQLQQQQAREVAEFNQAKTEAERLQSEVFIDKTSTETYYEYVPNLYIDNNRRVSASWYNLSPEKKKQILANTPESRITKFTRTRTITTPFTLTNYQSEYEKLPPNVKQFFVSPQEVTANQQASYQKQGLELRSSISEIQNRINSTTQKMEDYKEWWKRKPASYRDNPRNRENYEKRLMEYQRDLEAYNLTIRVAQRESGKIEKGVSANDIINYAEQYALGKRAKAEFNYSQETKFNQDVLKGNFDELFQKLGLGKETTFKQYQAKVNEYNQGVKETNQLLKLVSSVGFENLPTSVQRKINPSAVDWQEANPTERLIFDKSGNVAGVESGTLQQSLSIDEYNKLAKEQKTPEQQYNEWKQERAKKPFYLDVTTQEIKYPYETRGTFNPNAPKIKYFSLDGGAEIDANKGFFSTLSSGYKKVTSKFPDIEIPFTNVGGVPLVSMGVLKRTGSVKLKDIKTPASEYLGDVSGRVYEKMVAETPNRKILEDAFQQEYQTRFEDAYMKKILYGETDYETASKEFQESNTAKTISKKYGIAITEDTRKMRFVQKAKYGSALVGLQITKQAVDLVPTNYGDLIGKGALVYTGYSALKYVPSAVNLGVSGTLFVTGTAKAFSSKSTPTDVGAGLITAGISGASLGYAGYRYLRSPVVTTKIIKPKKLTLRSSASIGKDVKVITDQKAVNTVVYGDQKLSQTIGVGRRTIVTTKWRSLMNKYFKTNIPSIYEGVPANQPAIYGSDVFRGGRYKIIPSGYEKATKKLLDYGYTKQQAVKTLRYTAPVDVERYLKSGIINIRNDLSAVGKFTYETKKAVYPVDERLGIKTRGGRTLREVYNVERRIIDVNDKQFMLELRNKISTYLDKKGLPVKSGGVQFSTSISTAKVSDLQQGAEFLKRTAGFDIYKTPASYKDIFALSRQEFSMTATPKRNKVIVDIMNEQRQFTGGRSTLFEKEFDFTKGGTATQTAKTKPINVEKVVEKITQQKSNLPKGSPKADVTKILKDQNLAKLTEQLKGDMVFETAQTPKVVSVPKIKTAQTPKLDVAVIGATATQLKQESRAKSDLKLQIKQATSLKINQITSQAVNQELKQEIRQQLKQESQSSMLKAPITRLDLRTPLQEISIPALDLRTPTYEVPKTPPLPPFVIFSDQKLQKKIQEKRKQKQVTNLALFPDFTARALGLEAQEFGSVKEAEKELRKLQTGFGIRRGGRIKGVSPIDEKSLLRGIMK